MLHAPPSQFDKPVRRPSERSKLLVALATFCVVIAGWLGVRSYRDRHAPLPGVETPPGACNLWFVGSSTIQRWSTLAADMRPWPVVNRGIYAAPVTSVHRRMLNEPSGRRPAAIVFYGGDNDIAEGASAADAVRETTALLGDARRMFGPMPIFLLSVKPSPARWAFFPAQTAYNAAMRAYAARHSGMVFVDVVPDLLRDGRPGAHYGADGIHLDASGYAILRARLADQMRANLPVDLQRRCAAAASDN